MPGAKMSMKNLYFHIFILFTAAIFMRIRMLFISALLPFDQFLSSV